MELTSMFQAYTKSFYVACFIWIAYLSYHELSHLPPFQSLDGISVPYISRINYRYKVSNQAEWYQA